MSGYDVSLWTRDFGVRQAQRAQLEPLRLSWAAMGGPDSATLVGVGDVLEMAQALDMLRCPVVVFRQNTPAWWGYVHEVSVNTEGLRLTASLDSLVNRAAVVYSYVEPGSADVGQRRTTAWAQNDTSVAEYGLKEQLVSVDGATPTSAEYARDLHLAEKAWPKAYLVDGGGRPGEIELLCRGWWHTLDWRYYTNAGTDSESVTNQIFAIAADAQFVVGAVIEYEVPTTASEYAEGEITSRDLIEELLAPGYNSEPVLASVFEDRYLHVTRRAPVYEVDLRYSQDGVLASRSGERVALSPAGQWCAVDMPIVNMLANVASPSPFLIAHAELDTRAERWRLQPWGAPSPFDVLRMDQG